jgi:hypothetical protein
MRGDNALSHGQEERSPRQNVACRTEVARPDRAKRDSNERNRLQNSILYRAANSVDSPPSCGEGDVTNVNGAYFFDQKQIPPIPRGTGHRDREVGVGNQRAAVRGPVVSAAKAGRLISGFEPPHSGIKTNCGSPTWNRIFAKARPKHASFSAMGFSAGSLGAMFGLQTRHSFVQHVVETSITAPGRAHSSSRFLAPLAGLRERRARVADKTALC